MICQNCGNKMRAQDERTMCLQQHPYEIRISVCRDCSFAQAELSIHRYRARKLGLPDTLTVREWVETKRYFHGLCAYCRINTAKCLEHFIPLSIGVGTIKENCVPACYSCNRKKRNLAPTLVKSIPQADIERVREYLTSFIKS